MLVDASTSDDAGVYKLRLDCALVQTVDFFTPIVDDPFDFGQIAAANALSDVYAMGGRPITAMNLLAVPTDKISAGAIAEILRGGASKIKEARCALVGGHTIKNPEPIYGLSVTGLVHPGRILTNANARSGDLLILTKPLGTGIATTAIKRGLASPALARRATLLMKKLNAVGADLAERSLIKCATDITGFGLLGHLANICRASNVGAEITVTTIPSISREIAPLIVQGCVPGGTLANLQSAAAFTEFGPATERQKLLLADAQTSGGLLLCVPPARLSAVRAVLRKHRTPIAAVIGKVVRNFPGRIVIR